MIVFQDRKFIWRAI